MRLTVLLAALCAVLFTSNADARTLHHHRHHIVAVTNMASCDAMRPCYGDGRPLFDSGESVQAFSGRAGRRASPGLSRVMAEGAGIALGSDLISRARSYMGTNPTGWRRVWCARFMAMIAPRAAARLRNPNMARAWLYAGHRVGHCQVGAIAVLARGRRGGHVGVVTGCGPHGPRIVSGNHGHRVGEGVYSAGRVLAYVSAG